MHFLLNENLPSKENKTLITTLQVFLNEIKWVKRVGLLLFLFVALKGNAQQETKKVEQYCEVVATGRMFSNKVTFEVDYGEEKSVWKDNRLKDENGKFKKFNTVIDAINYLGKEGWSLVNAFPISNGNNPMVYHYVFKKEFPKAETE